MKKVFIDGSAGTTGLKIFERFQNRADLELLTIPEADRKNLDARIAKVCEADISFLCLPDAASREICEQLPQTVRLLDTSTAHGTLPDWVYGLPELSKERRAAVAAAVNLDQGRPFDDGLWELLGQDCLADPNQPYTVRVAAESD